MSSSSRNLTARTTEGATPSLSPNPNKQLNNDYQKAVEALFVSRTKMWEDLRCITMEQRHHVRDDVFAKIRRIEEGTSITEANADNQIGWMTIRLQTLRTLKTLCEEVQNALLSTMLGE